MIQPQQTAAATRREEILELLGSQPRVSLGFYPTPLQELPNLSEALGGPRIYVKRDDLSGLALGGNKTRSLEYVLAALLREEPEMLVTGANIQSNWCAQTSAAAARLGLPVDLVLRNSDHSEIQGNVLLDLLMGANVNFIDRSDLTSVMLEAIDGAVQRHQQQGVRARKVDSWASCVALGFVHLALEIHEQCEARQIETPHVWFAAAGPTQAGTMLGAKLLDWDVPITGVAPITWTNESMEVLTAASANAAAELLDSPIRFTADDVRSLSEYIGPGYGLPSPEGLAAMTEVARLEGVVLDPVYTGKAMAALFDRISRGEFDETDHVVFVHTGGVAALFAHRDAIVAHLETVGPKSASNGG